MSQALYWHHPTQHFHYTSADVFADSRKRSCRTVGSKHHPESYAGRKSHCAGPPPMGRMAVSILEIPKQIMNATEQFEATVNAHYERVFKFAMSLTRVESDARDLTQQTFYVWATKGHQLRDISKTKTWLFTTLHREFLMAQRRQGRFPHYELEEVAEQLTACTPAPADYADAPEV